MQVSHYHMVLGIGLSNTQEPFTTQMGPLVITGTKVPLPSTKYLVR
jgi:hypothetical protein